MKKRVLKTLPALVLALVIILAAGILNNDSWLHASSGEETTTAAPSEDVQGSSATQTLDLTSVPTEENTVETTEEVIAEITEEVTEETVEETTEETADPVEETTEPTEEEAPSLTLTAVGYSGVYNYEPAVSAGTMQVTPATLTVTTYSGTKTYDGNPLTAGGVISGFIWGENATFTVTGSQTEVGSSENTYTLVFDGTAKAENYVIKETLGTLTVK